MFIWVEAAKQRHVDSPKEVLFALYDSLMVLAPRGWRRAELVFAPSQAGLRLAELSAKGDGSSQPTKPPQLNIQARDEALRLSQAFGELHEQLRAGGRDVARATRLLAERGDGFSDVRLLDSEGKLVWFSRLKEAELEVLLMTDPLFEMLEGTQAAFHQLQGGLEARLSTAGAFAFDPDASMLRLELGANRQVELEATLLGQYVLDDFTWVWSWSQAPEDDQRLAKLRRICTVDERAPGLSALWRPYFHCDEGFAWALASSVCVSLGARGLYRARAPDGSAALFFAPMVLP